MEEIELDITGVAHGGVFVGRHEGRVVFVPDAVPGERVRVRLSDTRKKSFWRGEVLEVLEASPHRQPHVWPAADVRNPPEERPGGADFGHITLARQRELKADVLRDALARFGGIDDAQVTVEPLPGESEDGTRWRTRVSLHVDEHGTIGPYAARSHTVIPSDVLPLATAPVERAAAKLYGEPGRIELVQASDGRVRVLNRPESKAPRRGAADAERRRETIIETVGEREFRLDVDGFWQVHRGAAEALTALLKERLAEDVDPEAWHLDLYGGVGLFAATLAELGGPNTRVTTVESDPRATEHAGENLAEWIGARAETARVDRFLAKLVGEASDLQRERLRDGVVLLDPPRAGAGAQVVTSIATLQPAVVAYVACDPVALARDLKTFGEQGYEVRSIDALDLFPNSHHFETVAILTRR